MLLVINLWQVQEICCTQKIFREVLETMEPHIQWAPGGSLPGGKAAMV